MRKRLYKVKQGVWGAYESRTLYFETKKEANEYVDSHDYCEHDGYIYPSDETRKKLLGEEL